MTGKGTIDSMRTNMRSEEIEPTNWYVDAARYALDGFLDGNDSLFCKNIECHPNKALSEEEK